MMRFQSNVVQFVVILIVAMLGDVAFTQNGSNDSYQYQFQGNIGFTTKQLRDALIAEPDFLLATHPHSNRADVAKVTQRLLQAGYRNSGFPKPIIDVETRSDGGFHIRIEEGIQFHCGGVNVNGAQQIDVAQLVTRLTQPYPDEKSFPTFVEAGGKTVTCWVDDNGKLVKSEKPVWERGAPVKFDQKKRLNQLVKAALKDLGYSAASSQVKLASNDQEATVELIIDILDEGANDRADAFKVVGSDVNAPNDILAFLELKPGVIIDQVQLQRLTKRLWECGRFMKHNLHFDRDENGTGQLHIELADVHSVPPLKEPLSEIAIVFLRARAWLSGIDERGEDLAFTLRKDGCQLQFIQSKIGMAAQFIGKAESISKDDESSVPKMTFLVDELQVALIHYQSPEVWSSDLHLFQGSIQLQSKFAAANSDERFAQFSINASWHSERAAEESLISHVLNLSPADWLGFAYKSQLETKIHEHRLHVVRDENIMEINVDSGQIYRWSSDGTDVKLQVGLLEKLRNKLALESPGKTNVYDASQPVTSLAKFLVSESRWQCFNEFRELAQLSEKAFDPNLRSALSKLVSGGILFPFDAFSKHTAEFSTTPQFRIPDDLAVTHDLTRRIYSLIGKYTLKCVPELFSEGTWPMTVTREACFVLIGRAQHTDTVLKALLADESTGPLCDACVAYLLSMKKSSAVAAKFATESLAKMDPAKFNRDVNSLLSGRCGLWIAGVLNAINSLTPGELESLVQISPSEDMANCLRVIHARSAIDDERSWYQAARTGLEGMLDEIIRR